VRAYITRLLSLADGSPPHVNGDIAIKWEWSNFDLHRNLTP